MDPPSWCLGRLLEAPASAATSSRGMSALFEVGGRKKARVFLPSPPSYETAMVEFDLHRDCKNWLDKKVNIAKGATGKVTTSSLPLRMWKGSATGGLLEDGHLLISEITLTGANLSKLQVNVLVDLEGNTWETIQEDMEECYVQTKCLKLATS
jgi:hypothetical protein